MEIIKQGEDTSKIGKCNICKCEFTYLAGEVEQEEHDLYNIPLKYAKKYGGDTLPYMVQAVRFVRCPCCKTKIFLD